MEKLQKYLDRYRFRKWYRLMNYICDNSEEIHGMIRNRRLKFNKRNKKKGNYVL